MKCIMVFDDKHITTEMMWKSDASIDYDEAKHTFCIVKNKYLNDKGPIDIEHLGNHLLETCMDKSTDFVRYIYKEHKDDKLWNYNGPGWYFFDETNTDMYGPYKTYEEAIENKKQYIKWLDTRERA
jgi:hypothetical protein